MQPNEAVLHTDASLLPRRPLARAAWNYHLLASAQQPVALTYDMNILQTLDAPVRFLVTLNHADAIDERKIIGRFSITIPSTCLPASPHRSVIAKSTALHVPITVAPTGATVSTRTAS